eukprot:707580-Hanusia_phi.AAC.1
MSSQMYSVSARSIGLLLTVSHIYCMLHLLVLSACCTTAPRSSSNRPTSLLISCDIEALEHVSGLSKELKSDESRKKPSSDRNQVLTEQSDQKINSDMPSGPQLSPQTPPAGPSSSWPLP